MVLLPLGLCFVVPRGESSSVRSSLPSVYVFVYLMVKYSLLAVLSSWVLLFGSFSKSMETHPPPSPLRKTSSVGDSTHKFPPTHSRTFPYRTHTLSPHLRRRAGKNRRQVRMSTVYKDPQKTEGDNVLKKFLTTLILSWEEVSSSKGQETPYETF